MWSSKNGYKCVIISEYNIDLGYCIKFSTDTHNVERKLDEKTMNSRQDDKNGGAALLRQQKNINNNNEETTEIEQTLYGCSIGGDVMSKDD